ncbi:DinB superfamily metal-dependent hydrolase [Paenibacillus sp. 32O-W]|uniref:DinB family protein n=1 Tax=Paenibacillus sp. 32O-W TaxID=1695218 RepID=UPI000721F413|nr:DinB family protein [Paenibacillus sp. 32O-W]ALS29287.1 DinB superfamily metal-dependent hydrolase [Paenibacillus sp. 32O-W]
MNSRDDRRAFLVISKLRMVRHYLPKLQACLERLDAQSLWSEEAPGMNSIGGIAMHLIEHAERNAARLLRPETKFGQGIEQYFPQTKSDPADVSAELERAFAAFGEAVDRADPAAADMYAIYHLVEHTGYHTGQIVDRVQRMTGARFRFVQNGVNEQELKRSVDAELSGAELPDAGKDV